MTITKLFSIVALTLGLSFSAFAGTPKGDGKATASKNSPVETVGKATGTTYYVTGTTTLGGQPAYTFDQSPQNCEEGSRPCRFVTTSGSLSSPQLQTTIDGEVGLSIETWKD